MHNSCSLKKAFIIIAVLTLTVSPVIAQQKQGTEEVIKDTFTLKQYKQKILPLRNAGATAELAQIYKRVADYYYKNWYSDSMTFYYKQALQQYDKEKDSFHISYCYLRIGEVSAYSGKDQAGSLLWILPAASYFERAREYVLAAHSNYTISILYKSSDEAVKRKKYRDMAIELNKLGKDTLLDIIMLERNAEELRNEGKWKEAHAETLKGVALSRMINQRLFLKIGLLQMGKDFVHFDQLDQAIAVLEESVNIHATTREAVPETYRLLTICHIRLNNRNESEKYLSLYKKSIDSIVALSAKDNYDELLVQYETEKKQSKITSLEQENILKASLTQNQQRFIIGLVAGVVILLGAGWLMYRNFRKRRKLEDQLHTQQEQFKHQLQSQKEDRMMAEFNKQLAEVQLTALSAQMNPHFIFNCMNSIQKYVLKNEKTKALEFLQNFSDLMRSVLDNSAKTRVGLDEEIVMLEKYILLEQQRLEKKFDYRIDIAPDLQADFFEIPGMIIQPYVENAIWHGLMNLPEPSSGIASGKRGLLRLQFKKEGAIINCIVSDNGVGRKKAVELQNDKSPGRKSHGMAIAQKRLELLQKEGEQVPEIFVQDLNDESGKPVGTSVAIYIHVD